MVAAAPAAAQPYRDVVPLPNGWQPEGIAGDFGNFFWSGSRATGAVYRGNLKTGTGKVVIPRRPGGAATGGAHERDDLLDLRRIGEIPQAPVVPGRPA